MLLNPSQYSPQGLLPPFAAFQPPGTPQLGPSFFGQSGPYGVDGQAPYPFGAQQYPFAGQQQMNPFLQGQGAFTPGPFAPSPFAPSPFALGPNSPYAYNPFLAAGGAHAVHHTAQLTVQILGQLAQQILVQGSLTQQIGGAIYQLAQLAAQSVQAQQSLGPGQGFGLAGALSGVPGSQGFSYGGPGAQAGFSPQAWGLNRSTTIQ